MNSTDSALQKIVVARAAGATADTLRLLNSQDSQKRWWQDFNHRLAETQAKAAYGDNWQEPDGSGIAEGDEVNIPIDCPTITNNYFGAPPSANGTPTPATTATAATPTGAKPDSKWWQQALAAAALLGAGSGGTWAYSKFASPSASPNTPAVSSPAETRVGIEVLPGAPTP